jgi:hypothetical protein
VVIHSYRHRLGLAPGYAAYQEIERKLAALPAIEIPAITLDGLTDGNYPATDGSATAARFRGPRTHRQVPGAGSRPQLAAGSSPGIRGRRPGVAESRVEIGRLPSVAHSTR